MEFQSLLIFSCILTLLIILIKPLTTKAHDRRASGDCGTSGLLYVHLDLEGMTLGQGHDTPLGHGQQLCEILISRSNMAVKSYGPDTHFLVYVHLNLDLEGMTLDQGHDTPLGHGQQLCEILFRSNMAVRSYGPDTDFGCVCSVTLTLEISPWVKVMTHPWVMDNNCVKC